MKDMHAEAGRGNGLSGTTAVRRLSIEEIVRMSFSTFFTNRFVWGVMITVTTTVAVVAGAGFNRNVERISKLDQSAVPDELPIKQQGVGAIGRLEPGWKLLKIAPASASDGSRIESLLVEEGTEVDAGQVIAILDTQARRAAAFKEAEAQVLAARSKLALVKLGSKPDELLAQDAGVRNLKASLQSAEASFRRVSMLKASRVITDEEYDQKKFQVEMLESQMRQAESTLSAMRTIRPEDVAVAEAELAKSEAVAARLAAELEATNVRSPIRGRILKIHSRVGEKVNEDGIVEVGNTAEMHAVAEVYERDVPLVQVGQKALVWLQSFKAELAGEVVHVGWKIGKKNVLDNDPIRDTDARVVEVRIKLDAASSEVVSRLSNARVEIRITPSGVH